MSNSAQVTCEHLGVVRKGHAPGHVFQKGPALIIALTLPPRGWKQDWCGAPWPTAIHHVASTLEEQCEDGVVGCWECLAVQEVLWEMCRSLRGHRERADGPLMGDEEQTIISHGWEGMAICSRAQCV